MKKLFFLSFLISFSVHAGWSEKARHWLPSKVNAIHVGKTDRDTARKLMGRPDLARGEKEYWIVDGFKYALELTYKDNKVLSVHYNFPKKKFSIEKLKSDIDPKLLKPSPSAPHTSLVYEDEEGKMEVELTSGNVESVRFQ